MKTLSSMFVLMYLALSSGAQSPSAPKITTVFKDGITTVQMEPLKISGPKDEYHSLHVALSFSYPGEKQQPPQHINFEIQSIVKRHTLNSDLYIVFLIEDEKVFLSSSNRSAVKNPFPGRKMIGERIQKKMPVEMYLRLAKAKKSAIKMGGTVFEINDDQKAAMLELANRMQSQAGSMKTSTGFTRFAGFTASNKSAYFHGLPISSIL